MDDLAGKVVFVTGGASGIGLAMAEAFAKEGAKIVLA
ncbi:MAG: SDR family NAD(P)-dependent oxidoreductase, partial [Deltaproteobacteria bacterium]|nr:SDR family NAD(P)-dependent oxidoreductase [Deltaproteobacteria bacterium]